MSATVKALEAEFEAAVVELAHLFGWSAMAVRPAIKGKRGGWATPWKYDGVGWPDLTLVNPERGCIVFAELKIPPAGPSDDQAAWLERLGAVVEYLTLAPAGRFDAFMVSEVWTPADGDRIAALLSFGKVTQWRP